MEAPARVSRLISQNQTRFESIKSLLELCWSLGRFLLGTKGNPLSCETFLKSVIREQVSLICFLGFVEDNCQLSDRSVEWACTGS